MAWEFEEDKRGQNSEYDIGMEHCGQKKKEKAQKIMGGWRNELTEDNALGEKFMEKQKFISDDE